MKIESPRLILRALTRDEAETIVSGDRAVASWAPDYPTPADVGITAIALAGRATFPTEAMPWGVFVIIEKVTGESVGGIGFKGTPSEDGDVEIGYGICPSRQGHGIATEALHTLCEFARGRVRAILAETESENVASQRVLEMAGFLSEPASNTLLRWRRDLVDAAPPLTPWAPIH